MRKNSKRPGGRGPATPSRSGRTASATAGRGNGAATRSVGTLRREGEVQKRGAGQGTRGSGQSLVASTRPHAGTRSSKAGAAKSLTPARTTRPTQERSTGQRPAPLPVAAPKLEPVALPVAVRMETVDAERAGQRVDNFLSSRLKGVPKSAVYRVLRTGQVRVNGKRCKPELRLEEGDVVRIPPLRVAAPGEVAPPSDSLRDTLAQRIVHEDAEFLLLDKPSGLAAHGGSGVSLGAIEAMRAIRPTQDIELVHRLDRDTSGLLLFAKKHSALRRLQALIRESRVQKKYFALIQGSPARDRFEVDAALRKNQLRGGERMVEVDEDDGKPSLSRFRVIERYADCTLVEVEIITGRTHQIRVHALHAGHPLAGDPKYGDEDFNKLMKTRGLKRLFLHAHSLRFPWGEASEERHYSAPLGADLRKVLDGLPR